MQQVTLSYYSIACAFSLDDLLHLIGNIPKPMGYYDFTNNCYRRRKGPVISVYPSNNESGQETSSMWENKK